MNKQEYIRDMVEKYLSGELGEREWAAFKEEHAEDAFVNEAMEGFEMSKPSVSSLKELDKKVAQLSGGSGGAFPGWVSILAVAAMLVVVFIFIYPTVETDTNALAELKEKAEKPKHSEEVDTKAVETQEEFILEEEEVVFAEEKPLISEQLMEEIHDVEEEDGYMAFVVEDELTVGYDRDQAFAEAKNEAPVSGAMQPIASSAFKRQPDADDVHRKVAKRMGSSDKYIRDFKVIDYSSLDIKIKHKLNHEYSGTKPVFENKQGKYESADPQLLIIEVEYDDYFEYIFTLIDRQEYKQALKAVKKVEDAHPNDMNVAFYKGFLYYNERNYDKAIASFKRVMGVNEMTFFDESQWYLALSYEEQGNAVGARAVFEEIVETGGFYADKAKMKLGRR
jgi:tetratricopeptide (TPR) repeat protein